MRISLIISLLAALSSGVAGADSIRYFQATLDNTGAVKADGTVSTETGMTGFATFKLSEPTVGSPTLEYTIVFNGVDVGGNTGTTIDDLTPGNPLDNATAIHIHDTTGVNHSAATPHVLNLFGFPGQDDAQMVATVATSTVTGVWDDGDELIRPDNNLSTQTLTSALTALEDGELFLMLHTSSPNALPGTPGITIGGRIIAIPEPAPLGLALAGLLTGGGMTLRSRRVTSEARQ